MDLLHHLGHGHCAGVLKKPGGPLCYKNLTADPYAGWNLEPVGDERAGGWLAVDLNELAQLAVAAQIAWEIYAARGDLDLALGPDVLNMLRGHGEDAGGLAGGRINLGLHPIAEFQGAGKGVSGGQDFRNTCLGINQGDPYPAGTDKGLAIGHNASCLRVPRRLCQVYQVLGPSGLGEHPPIHPGNTGGNLCDLSRPETVRPARSFDQPGSAGAQELA